MVVLNDFALVETLLFDNTAFTQYREFENFLENFQNNDCTYTYISKL